jgi:hypothetical protein
MTSTADAGFAPAPSGGFAPQHRWDRNYFLAMVALIWLGVLLGFGWDVLDHVNKHTVNWPIIVHLHAFAMVSWLVLLTTQVLLIRARKPAVHRTLGVAGAAIAVFVVVLGLGVAVAIDRLHMGAKDEDPSFLSIQLADVTIFGTLVLAGVLLRNNASAHKRLMLLASMQIADAGFGRWIPFMFPSLIGPHFWGDYIGFEGCNIAMILGMGAYDLVTRGRLHPAYVLGALWALAIEVGEIWLYVTPAWKPIALRLIGMPVH